MPKPISLTEMVEAMELASDEAESFLEPDSGEIITVTAEDRLALEDPEPDLLPQWQREHLPRVRAAVESERCLRLPNRSEIHEWSIMERFARSVSGAIAGEALDRSLRGKGAFSRFRSELERLGLRDEWYSYRQAALEEIARAWLKEHGLESSS